MRLLHPRLLIIASVIRSSHKEDDTDGQAGESDSGKSSLERLAQLVADFQDYIEASNTPAAMPAVGAALGYGDGSETAWRDGQLGVNFCFVWRSKVLSGSLQIAFRAPQRQSVRSSQIPIHHL